MVIQYKTWHRNFAFVPHTWRQWPTSLHCIVSARYMKIISQKIGRIKTACQIHLILIGSLGHVGFATRPICYLNEPRRSPICWKWSLKRWVLLGSPTRTAFPQAGCIISSQYRHYWWLNGPLVRLVRWGIVSALWLETNRSTINPLVITKVEFRNATAITTINCNQRQPMHLRNANKFEYSRHKHQIFLPIFHKYV